MVATLTPLAIVLGLVATLGLLFFTVWERVAERVETAAVGFVNGFGTDIERANISAARERVATVIIITTVVLWLIGVILVRGNPIQSILILPVAFAMVAFGFQRYLRGRAAKRLKKFGDQLELVLRLISSGLRVGLSLRQAMVLVIEESPDPARSEFGRVVGRTNLGVPMDVALEDLVRRMPSEELRMLVDAIQVQTQTGGNLAKILDHLAFTIKSRRLIERKVVAMTGEATMSGYVIGALPIFVGAFVMLTQPSMRNAMIGTLIGHLALLAFVVLEVMGIFAIRFAMKLEI
jgi:tight adherence protein B